MEQFFLQKKLSELPVPTAKTESWKFTNFSNLFLDKKTPVHTPVTVSPLTYPNTVTITNEKIELKSVSKIKLTDLDSNHKTVKQALSELAAHFQDDYLWNKTIREVQEIKHLEIKESCTVLLDYFFASQQAYQHLIISVAPNCQVEVIEDLKSSLEQGAVCKHLTIIAEKNSNVEFISLNRAQDNFKTLDYTSFFTDESQLKAFSFTFGGEISRKNYYGKIFGAGSNLEISGLYTLKNNTHYDINSIMIHESADTTSEQIFKGLLDDEAKGIFTGKIFIKPDAQRVAAKQLNKNILMSKKAHVHSCPQLEIFADDVKCSHGSTTGKINDDELFYLQSRGISLERAKALLTQGFAQDIIFRLSDQALQRTIIENFHTYFGERLK